MERGSNGGGSNDCFEVPIMQRKMNGAAGASVLGFLARSGPGGVLVVGRVAPGGWRRWCDTWARVQGWARGAGCGSPGVVLRASRGRLVARARRMLGP
jgi:hypothetical protein